MYKMFNRIRFMILGRVLLVPFIVVMLVCTTLVYFFASNIKNSVAKNLLDIAEGHRNLIEGFLSERASDLKTMAQLLDTKQLMSQERLEEVFQTLQNTSPAFFDLGVFDEEGNHVAYVGPFNLKGKNYSQTEWFIGVKQNDLYISDVFLGFRKIPHFIIVVKKKSDTETCYLRATIDTAYFNHLIEKIRVGKTGEAFLVNDLGVFQTKRLSGGDLMEEDTDFHSYKNEGEDIKFHSLRAANGVHYLYATGKLPSTNWTLVVRQERNEAFAPLYKAIISALTLTFGGGAIVVAMAFFLASGLANKLVIADMEKREMGGKLIMAGRLAEVGQMSAGIAHEINNPLQIMKSEFALINDIISEVETKEGIIEKENLSLLKDSINQLGSQINRCKNITQGLLKFARKSETIIQSVNIKLLIEELVKSLEHALAVENIKIIYEYEEGLPSLPTDSTQLQQVLMNLINNAIYALKDKPYKEIRISLKREDENIVISVADNGCGIPHENLEKIFLPFFTTKPVGKGTGLGLSTVYGIIERLGGHITVSSEVGTGTVFTIYLPLKEELIKNHSRKQEGGSLNERDSCIIG